MQADDPFVHALHQWIEIFMRRSMGSFILYSKETGLSMSQLGALINIYHQGILGVSDIGDHLGVTSAAASQMLDRLVNQDLIMRSEDPNDRRGKQIRLTEKGRLVVQGSLQARQGWLKSLAGNLTADEKAKVIAALEILVEKADRSGLPPDPET